MRNLVFGFVTTLGLSVSAVSAAEQFQYRFASEPASGESISVFGVNDATSLVFGELNTKLNEDDIKALQWQFEMGSVLNADGPVAFGSNQTPGAVVVPSTLAGRSFYLAPSTENRTLTVFGVHQDATVSVSGENLNETLTIAKGELAQLQLPSSAANTVVTSENAVLLTAKSAENFQLVTAASTEFVGVTAQGFTVVANESFTSVTLYKSDGTSQFKLLNQGQTLSVEPSEKAAYRVVATKPVGVVEQGGQANHFVSPSHMARSFVVTQAASALNVQCSETATSITLSQNGQTLASETCQPGYYSNGMVTFNAPAGEQFAPGLRLEANAPVLMVSESADQNALHYGFENKTYIVDANLQLTGVSLASLDDNNVVTVGANEKVLHAYDQNQYSNYDLYGQNEIASSQGVTAASSGKDTETLPNDSFLGSLFVAPNYRGKPYLQFYSPFGAANVSIETNGELKPVQLAEKKATEVLLPGSIGSASIIRSDLPILVGHVSKQFYGYQKSDAYMLTPASKSYLGANSDLTIIAATQHETTVTVAGNGETTQYQLSKGQIKVLNSGGASNALSIESNQPIAALQLSAEDMVSYDTPSQLANRFVLPVDATKVSIACAKQTAITYYDANNQEHTLSCSGEQTNPAYLEVANSTHSLKAGDVFETDKVVSITYTTSQGDLRFLNGRKSAALATELPPNAPKITTAGGNTSQSPYPVYGLADPGVEVTLYQNGTPVQTVTANASTGAFVFSADLEEGDNYIYTKAVGAGGESVASNQIVVTYEPVNEPQEIVGPITEHKVYKARPNGEAYVINEDVVVYSGASMTFEAGARIEVAADKYIYTGSNSQIIIKGEQGLPVVFTGKGEDKWDGFIVTDSEGVKFKADYMIVENTDSTAVSVIHSSSGDYTVDVSISNSIFRYNKWGISLGVGYSHISNNTFYENSQAGVYLKNENTGAEVIGNTFRNHNFALMVASQAGLNTVVKNNKFIDNYVDKGDGTYWGVGIWVRDAGTVVDSIEDNEFTSNLIGVEVSDGGAATLTNNDFISSVYYGVFAHHINSHATVINGLILDSFSGIEVSDGAGVTVNGAQFNDNLFGVFVVDAGSYINAENNAFTGSEEAAVYVENATITSNINYNSFTSNDKGVFLDNTTQPISVSGNTFELNQYGVFLDAASKANIVGNNISNNSVGVFARGSENDPANDPQFNVNDNQLVDNSQYAIQAYQFSDQAAWGVLDARNNWWGTTNLEDIGQMNFDRSEVFVNNNVPQPDNVRIDFGKFKLSANGESTPENHLFGLNDNITLSSGEVVSVYGDLVIPPDLMLTIEEGVILNFENNASIDVYGSLNALGALSNRVQFVGKNQSISAWEGVHAQHGAESISLDYVDISNARDAVIFAYGVDASITNSVISGNKNGLLLVGGQNQSNAQWDVFPVIANNDIYNNNDFNIKAIEYTDAQYQSIEAANNWWGTNGYPGNVTADLLAIDNSIYDGKDEPENSPIVAYGPFLDSSAFAGGQSVELNFLTSNPADGTVISGAEPIIVTRSITIEPGTTVTIAESAVLEFMPGSGLVVEGQLNINGTAGNLAEFKIANGFANDRWNGIEVLGTADIAHADIANAKSGVTFKPGSFGSLTNSVVHQNEIGIELFGDGVNQANNPLPVINENRIEDNTQYNLTAYQYANNKSAKINASNNWWGNDLIKPILSKIAQFDQDQTHRPVVDVNGYYFDNSLSSAQQLAESIYYGPIVSDTTLAQGNYLLVGDLLVDQDATLTLDQGATLRFVEGASMQVHGYINVNGTESSLVTFTSVDVETKELNTEKAQAGAWQGIEVFESALGQTNNQIEFAEVRFAAKGVRFQPGSGGNVSSSSIHQNEVGVHVASDGVVVNNNSIVNNKTWGLFAFIEDSQDAIRVVDARNNWWGSAELVDVQSSIYDRDNFLASGNDASVDYSSFLNAENGTPDDRNFVVVPLFDQTTTQYTIGQNQVYVVPKQLNIPAGSTLTIESGARLEFVNGKTAVVEGDLVVNGTQANPVVFTSGNANKSEGDWAGLKVSGKDASITLNNVVVEYAQYGLFFEKGAGGNVTNSEIRNNEIGVYLKGGYSIDVDANDETLNPWPVINNNSIYDNAQYNLKAEEYSDFYGRKEGALHLNAKNNYWGFDNDKQVAKSIYDFYNNTLWSPAVDFGPYYTDTARTSLTQGVYLHGPIVGEVTLSPVANGYRIPKGLWVPADNEGGPAGHLVLEAGVAFDVDEQTISSRGILIEGSIDVQGTQVEPVVLSSTAPYNPAWQGLKIHSNNPLNRVRYAQITNADVGIEFSNGGYALVEHSQITNNKIGIKLRGGGGGQDDVTLNSLPVLTNNVIANNSNVGLWSEYYEQNSEVVIEAANNYWGTTVVKEINSEIRDYRDVPTDAPIINVHPFLDSNMQPVEIAGEQYLTSASQVLEANGRYLVAQDLTIEPGETLVVPAGAKIYFFNNRRITVNGGTLRIEGTADNQVELSAYSNISRWQGIVVSGAGSVVDIDHADISNASEAIRFNDANGSVTNTFIHDNVTAMVLTGASSPQITGNTLANNTNGILLLGDGASAAGSPAPVITNNEIFGHSNYNVRFENYLLSASTVDLTDNWWGSANVTDIAASIEFVNSDVSVADYSNHKTTSPYSVGFSVPSLSEKYFSPNSDGVKDTSIFSGSFDQTTSWRVRFIDQTDNIVFEQTGSGNTYNVEWNGQGNTADGVYVIELQTTKDGAVRKVYTTDVVLDTTAPVALFSDNLTSAPIKNVYDLPVEGVVYDVDSFSHFSLAWQEESNPGVWNTLKNTLETQHKTEETLYTWVIARKDNQPGFTPVPSGEHTLRIMAHDLAGNVTEQQVLITIDNLTISQPSWSKEKFDAKNGETANIVFGLSQPAEVTVKIFPEAIGVNGTPVRTLTQQMPAGENLTISWDGKNDLGNLVGSEAYRYAIYAENVNGYSAEYLGNTSSNRYNSSKTGQYTLSYNTFRNRFFTRTTTLDKPSRVNIRIVATIAGSSERPTFTAFGDHGKLFSAGTHKIAWDGRLPNGEIHVGQVSSVILLYELDEDTIRVDGEKVSILGPVVAGTPYVNVQVDPYIIFFSYGQLTYFKYSLDQQANVKITLLPPGVYDASDQNAIEVFNGVQNAGDHEVEWTGVDDADANEVLRQTGTEGAYSFVIEATGGAGQKATTKGVLNVRY